MLFREMLDAKYKNISNGGIYPPAFDHIVKVLLLLNERIVISFY